MTTVSRKLEDVIHEIACMELGDEQPAFQSDPVMARFKESGTELWVDTGDLEKAQSIWKSDFTALTTNNTLANQVVQTGVMDEVIGQTVTRLKEVAPDLSKEEQVMEIANKIAGFSLSEADLMRRAMGKKNKKLMDDISEKFLEGAKANGIKNYIQTINKPLL